MAPQDEFRRLFPRTASSAVRVRRFVTDALDGCAEELDLEAAVLLANELATNAILHASGDSFGLVVMVDSGAVRIAIEDQDPTPPKLNQRAVPGVGGLGLPIVGALSDAWGVCPPGGGQGDGKWVWFQLNRTPAY